ncbi:DUF4349 domain-containing protein [Chitinophaga sp. MM2321]|uniref:DUF4349 domain-containing protein n=1 Tax=Chitinophaga sp. MM2321 TaxID=3137178 RepID=UPI0032D59AB0
MRSSFLYLVIPVLTLAACGQSRYASNEEAANKSAVMDDYIASADSSDFPGNMSSLLSPSRKRVRSADVRCRVTNVFTATSRLEQIVTAVGGVVASSTLQNEYVHRHELPYTTDSLKKVQLYTPVANLTLRVPVQHLDSVVHTLTSMAGFIDHRLLTDEDMTLSYLSNSLKNNKDNQRAGKIAPDKKTTALDIAKYEDQKNENVIDRQMVNLGIQDKVAYSTFTVQLFQPEVADIQIVVNPVHLTRSGFGTEILTAAHDGGTLLRNILITLVQIWPFWIAAAFGWFAYKKLLAK